MNNFEFWFPRHPESNWQDHLEGYRGSCGTRITRNEKAARITARIMADLSECVIRQDEEKTTVVYISTKKMPPGPELSRSQGL